MKVSTFPVTIIGFLTASISNVDSIDWKFDGQIVSSDNCNIPGQEIGHGDYSNYKMCSSFCSDLSDCTHFTVSKSGIKRCTVMKGWTGDPVDNGDNLCGWINGRFTYDALPTNFSSALGKTQRFNMLSLQLFKTKMNLTFF